MSIIARNTMMSSGSANKPVNTAFVSGQSSLHAYNVSDATNPAKISSHSIDANAGSLAYSDKRKHVYVSTGADAEIVSVDVSDPTNMSTSQVYSAGSHQHCLALDDANDVLYAISYGTVRSYDVSDPSDVTLLDSIIVGFPDTDEGDGYIVLDLARKKAFAGNNSLSLTYAMRMIDISNPSGMASDSTVSNATDEAHSNRTSITVDPSRGYVFWLTSAVVALYDYTGGTLSQVAISYAEKDSAFGVSSYYRMRDKTLFAPNSSVFDVSAGGLPPLFALDSVPARSLRHDDYRMITFGITSDDTLKCFDTSDASNVTEVGVSAVNADIVSSANTLVLASAGPSGTGAYGR